MKKIIDRLFQRLFSSWLKYLQKDLTDCESVLDLGCGFNSFIEYCKVPYSVGVDLHEPSIEESKEKNIHTKYINADIRTIEFEPKSFDAVIALAVIEHMTKEEGLTLMNNMMKWAKKKVIITTPNGFMPHGIIKDNPLQEHLCGWNTGELRELGFKVIGTLGWKPLRGDAGVPNIKPAFLGEVISNITQYATYYFPRLSFVLYAKKEE